MGLNSPSAPLLTLPMNDGDSNLYAWLEQFRLQDSGNASDATHYSLVGGKYAIPESRHQQWLKRYALHLQQHAHEPVFFVEKRTPIFRMHFDLDYIQPDVPSLVQVIQMVQVLNHVFKTFFPDLDKGSDLFVAIVLKAPSLPKQGMTKTGYHVIWPYMLVNCDQALTMRLACITEAIQRFGERTAPYNSYEDLLDECVFMENGLRMVGSDKAKRCDMCDGKRKVNGNMCTTCKGLGKVCEKRVYEPYIVVDAHGDIDEVRLSRLVDEDSKHRLVRWCSIRSTETSSTAGYFKPPLAMQVTYETVAKDRKKKTVHRTGGAVGGAGEIKLQGCKWLEDAVDVSENKQVREEVEMFIRTSMGCAEWRELIARRMFYSESAQRYLVKSFGLGCQYCLNVRRCHGSSSIFFVIDVNGIVQRCYSKKKFDGIDTPCSKFASPRVQLSKVLLRVLFPAAAYSSDIEPTVLSTPVQSTVPFCVSEQVVLRQPPTHVHKYVNVLTTLAPRALAAQQLWAQQQALKLQHALTKQKTHGKGKPAKKTKIVKGAKPAVAATPAIMPTAGLKAEELFKLDKQRAQEQESRVKRLQDEMGNVAKKSKRSNK